MTLVHTFLLLNHPLTLALSREGRGDPSCPIHK